MVQSDTPREALQRLARESQAAAERIQKHIDRTAEEGRHLQYLLEQLDAHIGRPDNGA